MGNTSSVYTLLTSVVGEDQYIVTQSSSNLLKMEIKTRKSESFEVLSAGIGFYMFFSYYAL